MNMDQNTVPSVKTDNTSTVYRKLAMKKMFFFEILQKKTLETCLRNILAAALIARDRHTEDAFAADTISTTKKPSD